MRARWIPLPLILITLPLTWLAGCQDMSQLQGPNGSPSFRPAGDPITITHEGITLELLGIDLRRSYQNYYLMKYPPEGYQFLQIVLSIEGVEVPVEWGEDHLQLDWGAENLSPAFARPITLGEGYQYLSNDPLEFAYEFYFVVPAEVQPQEARLIIAQEATLPLPVPSAPSPMASRQALRPEQPEPIALSGWANQARSEGAVVVGGRDNQAGATFTSVGGGRLNQATQAYGTVAGGRENAAGGFYSMIGGGYGNRSEEREITIGGGSRNLASGRYAAIGGGIRNQAYATSATIAGGAYNQAEGLYAVVGGGTRNLAVADASVVAGGAGNHASGAQAAVAGGLENLAAGRYSTVSGGYKNLADGDYAVAIGGEGNQALADHSLAAGRYSMVRATHQGALVLSDSQPFEFASASADELAVRATGGIRMVTAVDGGGDTVAGAYIAPGSGSWSTVSDAALKDGWQAVDPVEVLYQVNSLSIATWNYRSQPPDVRHLGPTAQDFRRAFDLGESNRTISSVDADGVALAAIQGLSIEADHRDERLAQLEARLQRLENELATARSSPPVLAEPAGFDKWLAWLAALVLGLLLGLLIRVHGRRWGW